MNIKELLEMELHEKYDNGPVSVIMRVPGGWIYWFVVENGTGGYDMSSCFVPEPREKMLKALRAIQYSKDHSEAKRIAVQGQSDEQRN